MNYITTIGVIYLPKWWQCLGYEVTEIMMEMERRRRGFPKDIWNAARNLTYT